MATHYFSSRWLPLELPAGTVIFRFANSYGGHRPDPAAPHYAGAVGPDQLCFRAAVHGQDAALRRQLFGPDAEL